jgi:hypothetical protein
LVPESIDLIEITDTTAASGASRRFPPTMMTALLLYVGLDAPDFPTIPDFRKRHRRPLGGLVKLGHVALDGTKIKANASKHKAMTYGRMEERATELEAEGRLAAHGRGGGP